MPREGAGGEGAHRDCEPGTAKGDRFHSVFHNVLLMPTIRSVFCSANCGGRDADSALAGGKDQEKWPASASGFKPCIGLRKANCSSKPFLRVHYSNRKEEGCQ